ncbi:MAG: putative bifunctional diguanylate cyclase/phosphodiesterase [Solirubrobacteraceae bacterium]
MSRRASIAHAAPHAMPMPLSAGLSRPSRLAINGAGIALTLAVVALMLHLTGALGADRLNTVFDRWVYSGVEIGACAIVLARAALVRKDRRSWLLLAIGMGFYAFADLYWTLVLQPLAEPPSPSAADAGYLLFYPCAFAMIVGLVSSHLRKLHASVWLDGAIGALTVAAIGSSLALSPVVHGTHGSLASVTTNMAYPLGDFVLIVFLLGVFALTDWRPGGTWLLLALGFAVMAIADSIYLFQVAEGTYAPGTLLDASWPAGFLLLALSAWTIPRDHKRIHFGALAMMLVPTLFSAIALLLLIRGNYVHQSAVPETLAGLAVLAAGLRFTLTFNDVRRLSAVREREARTDYLTGLSNRREFYARLNSAIEGCRMRGTSFALLTIDLDRFKELNDTLGHYAGDLLLAQIGPRMQSVVRGDAVARLGGDEFGLILRDSSAAAVVAERINEALRKPFEIEGLPVSVRGSVGIAIFPDDAQTTDGLLQRADVAMYQAKEARSRYAFYSPGSNPNTRERLGLVADLKKAVEQGGLIVYYQPQVDLRTNTVSGVEALVRWQHPSLGLIGADRFVTIAEQTGVMRELTISVLDQSLAQQRAWLDEGRELDLAVNLSATSLLDAAFPGEVRRLLERWRTPPGMLRLEITESVLIAEGARVHRMIESLCDLGVNLSLDDFGTGYSPLAYLRELPVTEIKIDRSFIAAMMSDRDTATIVRSLVELARRLGIDVVAEGIETAGQLELLRSFECPFAQGYLFSRPLPAQTIGRWLREDALEHIAEEVLAATRLGPIGFEPVPPSSPGEAPAGPLTPAPPTVWRTPASRV